MGWGKESRLGWVALMEWEKESRFYSGQRGWDGEESRFYGGWRGWDGRKKVVFMVDGGDGMREECRFYGGWGRKSFQDELVVNGWWKESRLAKF